MEARQDFNAALDEDLKGTNFERLLARFRSEDAKPWFSFEKLVRDNLNTIYHGRFREVELTTAGTSGIDIFAIDNDGKRWAIQVKMYDENYYVSEGDVNSFIAHAKRSDYDVDYMLLVMTTNLLGRNTLKLIRNTPGFNTLVLDDLKSCEWVESVVEPAERYELRHDQPEILERILTGFETSDKGRYIDAPGTGKTVMGKKVAEALDAKTSLVMESSIGLLDQVEREHLEQGDPNKRFKVLRVYSQKEMDDELVEFAAERSSPPTTDPEAIADEILNHLNGHTDWNYLTIFVTYHSSPRIAKALEIVREQFPDFKFGFVDVDEAHRTTGVDDDSNFKTVHKIAAMYKLFKTATQRVAEPNIDKPVISMDDPKFYGPDFWHKTFGARIDKNYLADYDVSLPVIVSEDVLSLISDRKYVRDAAKMLKTTDARSLAIAVYLLKSIGDFDRHKVLAFHNTLRGARRFSQRILPLAAKWFGMDLPLCLYIDGKMPRGERAEVLSRFEKATTPVIISNVRVLTEGIDAPDADGIIFVDPKYSKIDIAQAIGRVLRKSGDKRSLVMIPAFTDLTDVDETLRRGEFADVAAIVRQMGFDERIEEKIRLATHAKPWTPPRKPKAQPEWVAVDVTSTEWQDSFFFAVYDRKRFMLGAMSDKEFWSRYMGFIDKHGCKPSKHSKDFDERMLGNTFNKRRRTNPNDPNVLKVDERFPSTVHDRRRILDSILGMGQ